MNVIWPTRAYETRSGIGWFRASAALGGDGVGVVYRLAGGLYAASLMSLSQRLYCLWILAPMAVIYLMGRGFRYILSGE